MKEVVKLSEGDVRSLIAEQAGFDPEGCNVCGGEGCPSCAVDDEGDGCDVCGGDGCPHCVDDGTGRFTGGYARLPEVKLTEVDMASDTDGTDVGDPLGDLIKVLEQAGDILLGAQGMTEESPELGEYRDKVSAAENAVTEALRQAKADRDGTW